MCRLLSTLSILVNLSDSEPISNNMTASCNEWILPVYTFLFCFPLIKSFNGSQILWQIFGHFWMESKTRFFYQIWPQIVSWLAKNIKCTQAQTMWNSGLYSTLSSCLLTSEPMREASHQRLVSVWSLICSPSICGYVLCVLPYARYRRHCGGQEVLKVVFILKVKVTQLCPTLCNPMDCSLPGSPVHGILQARTLEWVAIPFPRGSFQPRIWTKVSCTASRFFTIWAREAHVYPEHNGKSLKDFRLGSTFLRSAFQNCIWPQCERWMVREGCHLPLYLKNTWAILEAFWREVERRKYLLHTGGSYIPNGLSFQTPAYHPVLLSVPTLHIASISTKATEDKQPNHWRAVAQISSVIDWILFF